MWGELLIEDRKPDRRRFVDFPEVICLVFTKNRRAGITPIIFTEMSNMTAILRRLGAFLLILGLLSGCVSAPPVSTNYDASEGVTTYRTRAVALSGLEIGSGLGRGARVQMRALASCPGPECTPQNVVFVFKVSGSSDLRMENRTVELIADGKRFRSEREEPDVDQTIEDVDYASGTLTSVQLTFNEFRTVAEAGEVSGSLGSSRFSLGYERRSPFRTLVREVRGESQPSES